MVLVGPARDMTELLPIIIKIQMTQCELLPIYRLVSAPSKSQRSVLHLSLSLSSGFIRRTLYRAGLPGSGQIPHPASKTRTLNQRRARSNAAQTRSNIGSGTS